MNQPASGGFLLPDPQIVLQWAQFYAFTMQWVIQPIHKFMGYAQDGRKVCSCELTGKKWNNCSPEKPGKHPWKGWKQAPMETPEQGYSTFFATWSQYPHGVNIGVRTGRVSNIWALDLDVGSMKNGIVELSSWLEKNHLPDSVDTLSARTGGGGLHHVFRYPAKTDKIATVAPHPEIGPAVDIKGDGGYILVAPSVHASGRQYEWLSEPSPAKVHEADTKIVAVVEKRKRASFIDLEYTPSLEELKDHADSLTRKESKRSKDIGRAMVLALDGKEAAGDGSRHNTYRDVLFSIKKKWPRANREEILTHFEDSVRECFPNPDDYAVTMEDLSRCFSDAEGNDEDGWVQQVALDKNGKPIAGDANLLLFFRHHQAWQKVFGYNLRRNRPMYLRSAPLVRAIPKDGDFEMSRDKTEISLWFQTQAEMMGRVNKDDLLSALLAAAWDNPFDPLVDFVTNLRGKWDGTPRLATALQRVAGSPDTEWTRLVFPVWFRSLVARILNPGCKVDTMLILEGFTGFRKSTFFSSLLPDRTYFSDSLKKVQHDVESIRLVHSGPAIFEIGELSGLKKSEVEDIKAFLSAFQDDLRPLYEAYRTTPRRCVFVGTTNRNDYLRDETGGRRFWPVRVQQVIDTQLVLAERDQWFAEALAFLEAGHPWWLNGSGENLLAQTEQDERYEEDIWEQPIREWLADVKSDSLPTNSALAVSGSQHMTQQMNDMHNSIKAGEFVTTMQVALYALKLEIKNARTSEGSRINKILRRFGWAPAKTEDKNKKGIRAWRRPFAQ